MFQKLFFISIVCILILRINSQYVSIIKNEVSFSVNLESNRLILSLKRGNVEQLRGEIGVGLQKPLQNCIGVENCFENSDVRLHIDTHIDGGFTILWQTYTTARIFEDCFELGTFNWFGGPERFDQHWPIERISLTNFANVLQEDQRGAVVEPYWLNSAGAYIYVDEKVRLFINQNTATTENKVCFSAKSSSPYPSRSKVVLHYTIVSAENAREAHLHAVEQFLGKPTGHPNPRIVEKPIWSTWARYKRNVNDEVVRAFAQEIVQEGYDGQLEIDDDWEDCYGALTFRQSKFGDIKNTVAQIKQNNFTVSLWVHPFINVDCSTYSAIGTRYSYFVQNTDGSALTQWWNSQARSAQYLDFTKAEVRHWFTERLKSIQEAYGIDSFKFDAGETSWMPQVPVLQGDSESTPNNIAQLYVRTCASFGDLVEVRVGWKTQDLPVFVRMIDKDSTWGSNNGLYTLITTLLQMNLNGYTMVLPDMVGGNGYNQNPSAELFVRWLQANTFMPSIQFSYVPWDYKDFTQFDVRAISRKFVDLHIKYTPYILKQMQNSVEYGKPVNSPLWWIAPTDAQALKEDTEFLLGEDIIVAPVITESAVTRRVYLPEGEWIDGNTNEVHQGPKTITSYNAPIDVLPYFIRKGSDADLGQNGGGGGNGENNGDGGGTGKLSLNIYLVFVILFKLLATIM